MAAGRVHLVAVGALVALGVGACGDDGGDGGGGDRGGGAAAYREAAASVCGDLRSATADLAPPGDLTAAVAFVDEVLPAAERARDGLAALEPPADVADLHGEVVGALDARIEGTRRAGEAARANDVEAFAAAVGEAERAGAGLAERAGDAGLAGCL